MLGVAPLCNMRSGPIHRSRPLFEGISRQHPETGAGIRRTLKRRIRSWRTLNGRDRDVLFRQEYPRGGLE